MPDFRALGNAARARESTRINVFLYHATFRRVSMMGHVDVGHGDAPGRIAHVLVLVRNLHRVGWQRFSIFHPNLDAFNVGFAGKLTRQSANFAGERETCELGYHSARAMLMTRVFSRTIKVRAQ